MANFEDNWVDQLHDWLMTPPTRARGESERKTMSKLTPEEYAKAINDGDISALVLHIAALEAENTRLRKLLSEAKDKLPTILHMGVGSVPMYADLDNRIQQALAAKEGAKSE